MIEISQMCFAAWPLKQKFEFLLTAFAVILMPVAFKQSFQNLNSTGFLLWYATVVWIAEFEMKNVTEFKILSFY